MKKGCLARGLATLFFLCTLGLAGATYYLYGQNVELKSQLDQANARIKADEAASRHKPGKSAQGPGEWLAQAQGHINKAGQDLMNFDLKGAGDEATLAGQSLTKAPKKMSADAQKQYDSINKKIASVQQHLTSIKRDASTALRKITSFGGGQ
ncbi:MAG TPA: hypothetical protein VFW40_00315 [Capsulimonadaceae bacterium]|nr:hypothetical protein [Capsulimonadaceae bacterium]